MVTTPLTLGLQKALEILPPNFPKVPPGLEKAVTVTCLPLSSSVLDVRQYYSRHMEYVPAQPRVRRDILASLLERNASEVAAQQDWEAEWNTHGLTSRLTEEVRKETWRYECGSCVVSLCQTSLELPQEYRARKRKRLQKKLSEQLRSSLQQGSATSSAGLAAAADLQSVLNSFTGEMGEGGGGGGV